MKAILMMHELDSEYRIKPDFFAALKECYGPILQMGLGEPLYSRQEVEEALKRHALDNRPNITQMKKLAKEKQSDGSIKS